MSLIDARTHTHTQAGMPDAARQLSEVAEPRFVSSHHHSRSIRGYRALAGSRDANSMRPKRLLIVSSA
jgi:hypothetical protein